MHTQHIYAHSHSWTHSTHAHSHHTHTQPICAFISMQHSHPCTHTHARTHHPHMHTLTPMHTFSNPYTHALTYAHTHSDIHTFNTTMSNDTHKGFIHFRKNNRLTLWPLKYSSYINAFGYSAPGM